MSHRSSPQEGVVSNSTQLKLPAWLEIFDLIDEEFDDTTRTETFRALRLSCKAFDETLWTTPWRHLSVGLLERDDRSTHKVMGRPPVDVRTLTRSLHLYTKTAKLGISMHQTYPPGMAGNLRTLSMSILLTKGMQVQNVQTYLNELFRAADRLVSVCLQPTYGSVQSKLYTEAMRNSQSLREVTLHGVNQATHVDQLEIPDLYGRQGPLSLGTSELIVELNIDSCLRVNWPHVVASGKSLVTKMFPALLRSPETRLRMCDALARTSSVPSTPHRGSEVSNQPWPDPIQTEILAHVDVLMRDHTSKSGGGTDGSAWGETAARIKEQVAFEGRSTYPHRGVPCRCCRPTAPPYSATKDYWAPPSDLTLRERAMRSLTHTLGTLFTSKDDWDPPSTNLLGAAQHLR